MQFLPIIIIVLLLYSVGYFIAYIHHKISPIKKDGTEREPKEEAKYLAVVLTVCLIIGGIGYATWYYIERKVCADNVVGVWKSYKSYALQTDYHGEIITINEDGTFSRKSFEDTSNGKQGKWKIEYGILYFDEGNGNKYSLNVTSLKKYDMSLGEFPGEDKYERIE